MYGSTGRGAHVAVSDHAKLLNAWDPARPDENVEYYQGKVLEIWERFRAFADSEGLRPYSGDPDSAADQQLSLF